MMQICSLLPSATEILYALNLGDSVAGVTRECDFPPEAAKKPVLIRPRVDSRFTPSMRTVIFRGRGRALRTASNC